RSGQAARRQVSDHLYVAWPAFHRGKTTDPRRDQRRAARFQRGGGQTNRAPDPGGDLWESQGLAPEPSGGRLTYRAAAGQAETSPAADTTRADHEQGYRRNALRSSFGQGYARH